MQRDIKITDLTEVDLRVANAFMTSELITLPSKHPIRKLAIKAWTDFKDGKFTYDGATFVRERNGRTLFEIAALIHDWRNSSGCVGKEADQEMLDIMVRLNYPVKMIITRWLFCRATFLNVFRHKCMETYCETLPADLYKLSNY